MTTPADPSPPEPASKTAAPTRRPTRDYRGPAPSVPGSVTGFAEIEVESEGAASVLVHTEPEGPLQAIVLGASTCAFVLFIIVFLPWMNPSKTGTTLWIVVGLIVLGIAGFLTQSQARSTRIRIGATELEIEQGSPIDREHVAIGWREIVGVELEPVNPTDGRKGMQLRVLLREGAPVDTLAGLSIGDLNEARRYILECVQQERARSRA